MAVVPRFKTCGSVLPANTPKGDINEPATTVREEFLKKSLLFISMIFSVTNRIFRFSLTDKIQFQILTDDYSDEVFLLNFNEQTY